MRSKATEKQTAPVPAQPPEAAFGGGSKRGRKKWVIIITLIVLAGVGVAAWFVGPTLFNAQNNNGTGANATDKEKLQAERTAIRKEVAVTQQAAQEATAQAGGDVNKGLSIYDTAIKGASGEEKTALYADKALLAVNNGRLEDAAAAVKEAVEAATEKTDNSVYFAAAVVYEQQKDYAKAIEYYQKAYDAYVEAVGSGEMATPVYYKKQIARLEAL